MIPEHVIEAHAAAEAGEFARRARAYDAAATFGHSAWRGVERDDSPAAVEGFLKGTRVESWGLQMADDLDRAHMVAVLGVTHAHRLARGTLLEAWAQLRLLEVQSALAGEWLRPTREGAWQLAARLSGTDWATELRFVTWYTTMNAAVKLGEKRAAELAERSAERALRELGDSPFEHALRSQQALFATWNGRFDDAHRLIQANHELNDERGRQSGPQFPLAHLFLASGETDEGLDVLQSAVNQAADVGNWQAIRSALGYLSRWVESEAVRIPAPDEVAKRLSPAVLN